MVRLQDIFCHIKVLPLCRIFLQYQSVCCRSAGSFFNIKVLSICRIFFEILKCCPSAGYFSKSRHCTQWVCLPWRRCGSFDLCSKNKNSWGWDQSSHFSSMSNFFVCFCGKAFVETKFLIWIQCITFPSVS